MDFSLIPFGLSLESNSLVDVQSVPRGKGCGCICPSCKTPLIAKQGGVKEWHFAHASKNVSEQVENACEYSFLVSVRLMALQLIGDSFRLKLPPFTSCVSNEISRIGYVSEEYAITKQREIDLTDIETERMGYAFTVDICGRVNGYKFIIHFSYQGRINSGIESDLHGAKCGMIYISLDHFVDYWRDARDSNKTDRQLLNEFLSEDLGFSSTQRKSRTTSIEQAKHKDKRATAAA